MIKSKSTNRCTKITHNTKEKALYVRKKLDNYQLNIYFCKPCGGWHLGGSNNPSRKLDRLNRLFKTIGFD
jgi:hypothetical protein